jgi:Ca2+-binding EF-hand superfamily protein
MSKLGVFLARQELTTVYNHFDMNKDGKIQYDEFIGTLRVSPYNQLILNVSNRLI